VVSRIRASGTSQWASPGQRARVVLPEIIWARLRAQRAQILATLQDHRTNTLSGSVRATDCGRETQQRAPPPMRFEAEACTAQLSARTAASHVKQHRDRKSVLPHAVGCRRNGCPFCDRMVFGCTIFQMPGAMHRSAVSAGVWIGKAISRF
jgi:hypothetical protein